MREQDLKKCEAIRAQCEARGIAIEKREQCYLLHGPGVDLMTAEPADLSATDLLPYGSSRPSRL